MIIFVICTQRFSQVTNTLSASTWTRYNQIWPTWKVYYTNRTIKHQICTISEESPMLIQKNFFWNFCLRFSIFLLKSVECHKKSAACYFCLRNPKNNVFAAVRKPGFSTLSGHNFSSQFWGANTHYQTASALKPSRHHFTSCSNVQYWILRAKLVSPNLTPNFFRKSWKQLIRNQIQDRE